MKLSPNAPCPCGLPQKYKRCCQRLHRGAAAETPEALMRSRFSAFAVGAVDYLMETTDPEGPQAEADAARWRSGLLRWCRVATFERLEVLEATLDPDGARGTVTFHATIRAEGADHSFRERSRFRRVDGRWRYVDGDLLEASAR